MIAKRKEFIDRLLRISQLNEELINLGGDKSRQPAFTRRIRLVQMGKAELNLPINENLVAPNNHNCKILVIDKRPQRYQTSADNRNKTPNLEVQHTESLETSPQKMEPQNVRFLLQKKKSIHTFNEKGNEDISFVSPIKFETKKVEGNQSQNQYKRCNLLSKKMASQPKNLGFNHTTQIRGFFCTQSQKSGIVSGVKLKGQQRPYTASFDKDKGLQSARKAKLISMKQINKNYAKPFVPPPRISAKSYIIGQVLQQGIRVVVAYNSKNSQEIASLTKIMTCILTIELCQREKFNIDNENVKIGRYETNIGGTTADLKMGQIYTIKQLLYGLMLPSGNDASLALAVWAGRKYLQLYPQNDKDSKQSTQCSSKTLLSPLMNKYTKSGCYARFVREMNEKAKQLNMVKTKYANSHGLSNQNNRSTSYDICLLCNYAIKNSLFRQIVGSRSLQTIIRYEKENEVKAKSLIQINCSSQEPEIDQLIQENSVVSTKRNCGIVQSTINYSSIREGAETVINTMPIRWQNTHKLLLNKPDEYLGVKTGTTTTAGPCLSSLIKINNRQFIIIVLACAKLSFRFKETQILKKWLYKNEGIVKKIKRNSIQIEIQKQSSESEEEQDKLAD